MKRVAGRVALPWPSMNGGRSGFGTFVHPCCATELIRTMTRDSRIWNAHSLRRTGSSVDCVPNSMGLAPRNR